MREMTVRICFSQPSLGSVKADDGKFYLPRSPSGQVLFMASWHACNMKFAANILGRHQGTVGEIRWDMAVDGTPRRDGWHRRHLPGDAKRSRYALHESFLSGQVVCLRCAVPAAIGDADLHELMAIAGKYCGLSPARPNEFGRYEVVEVFGSIPAVKDVGPEELQLPRT